MNFPVWYKDIIDANSHVLIGGSTGSGKSVLLNGLICRLMCNPCGFVYIDPKRVELARYKNDSHCMAYCTEKHQIIDALKRCIVLMEKRFQVMSDEGLQTSNACPIYIVIDELADLMIDPVFKKELNPLLIKLTTLGRASKIFVIACTQKIKSVIAPWLRVNFDFRICLHVTSSEESKAVIDQKGGENLPRFGSALVKSPLKDEIFTGSIPFYSRDEILKFLA